MPDISSNLSFLRSVIPDSVKIVAVSKTKPPAAILEAYNAGQRVFGENRVQEILNKKDQLPSDIEWHMIGHLQSNKVRQLIPFVSLIHSVDSQKILSVINSESSLINRITNCLLQVHIAEEETKSGFSAEELNTVVRSGEFRLMKNVRICGLMGMATFTDNKDQVRKEFSSLSGLFRDLKKEIFRDDPVFTELSMGMSGDYEIAVSQGSTMIRVGSLIFGMRNKTVQ